MTDPTLYAIALADPGLSWSQHPHPQVTVLSGSIRAGDEVEVVRADGTRRPGTVSSVPYQTLSAADHDGEIAFADLSREDVGPGDVICFPGLSTPPLSVEGAEGFRRLRLLHSVQEARRSGFATGYAPLLRRLPDEAVVLLLEKAARDALRPPKSPHFIRTAFEKPALLYEAIGLREEADHLRLIAAALLEGRPAAAALLALAGSVPAPQSAVKPVRTATMTPQADWMHGVQTGTDENRTTPELAAQGEAIRRGLQEQGRAVGLGWCSKCKDAVRLTPALRCPRGHDNIKDVRVVLPSEAQETEQLLRRRHG